MQSQLVQLYVSVTEGNRRVTDLTGSDFVLTEDGGKREIHRLDSETVPLQVALLLDTSGSMTETLAATQEAAVAFVESLQPEDRVSFIPFNSDIRLVPQLSDDRIAIVSAIRQAQARGATKLYDALLFAMKHLGKAEGRRVIVVFSDGEDTARISSLETVLNAAARHGFPIYTIAARAALRTDALSRVLRQLAEINSGRMFVVDDPDSLRHTLCRGGHRAPIDPRGQLLHRRAAGRPLARRDPRGEQPQAESAQPEGLFRGLRKGAKPRIGVIRTRETAHAGARRARGAGPERTESAPGTHPFA